MTSTIKTPFDGPVCDFCLAPRPKWSYDASDVSVAAQVIPSLPEAGGHPGIHYPSVTAWAACTRCATIIDRRDVRTLAQVAADGFMKRSARHYTREMLTDYIVELLVKYTELLPALGKRRRPTQEELNGKPDVVVGDLQEQSPPGMN